jgi:hypothetical protein
VQGAAKFAYCGDFVPVIIPTVGAKEIAAYHIACDYPSRPIEISMPEAIIAPRSYPEYRSRVKRTGLGT